MAADGHLGYTKMATTSQPFADRCDVCFYNQVIGVSRSNGADFDDLKLPEPQFQGHSSLKVNISQTVDTIHSFFGSRQWFSGSMDRMALFRGSGGSVV